MTITQSLLAFAVAAGVLTLTPGLDTALVLRTAATEGRRPAIYAAMGVALGVVGWGAIVAMGLGALLLASSLAFTALKAVGAAYLLYLGTRMLVWPRHGFDLGSARPAAAAASAMLQRGALTNLLNPKVGLFYLAFLPQFVPEGVPAAPFMLMLAGMHALMGIAWLSALAAGVDSARAFFDRPRAVGWLDRMTGRHLHRLRAAAGPIARLNLVPRRYRIRPA